MEDVKSVDRDPISWFENLFFQSDARRRLSATSFAATAVWRMGLKRAQVLRFHLAGQPFPAEVNNIGPASGVTGNRLISLANSEMPTASNRSPVWPRCLCKA